MILSIQSIQTTVKWKRLTCSVKMLLGEAILRLSEMVESFFPVPELLLKQFPILADLLFSLFTHLYPTPHALRRAEWKAQIKHFTPHQRTWHWQKLGGVYLGKIRRTWSPGRTTPPSSSFSLSQHNNRATHPLTVALRQVVPLVALCIECFLLLMEMF